MIKMRLIRLNMNEGGYRTQGESSLATGQNHYPGLQYISAMTM